MVSLIHSEVLVESGDVVTELPVWHGRKGNVSWCPIVCSKSL
ncbi:MAG: hypothetical protein CM15mP21_8090 [Hyphomicrobiales bacterium]|nr:MAG: hypothetical protein CM15mP21_8090 [Hyphomicrobiales bacterium]